MKKLLYIALLSTSFSLSAQISATKQVPQSPNAASLGKFGDAPVSLYTGQINPNIPIHTIQLNDFSFPINLSYASSGLKVHEYPSWVGMGWTLTANGLISRQVKGIPDEVAHGFNGYEPTGEIVKSINANNYTPTGAYTTLTEEQFKYAIAEGNYDGEPDVFNLSAPGLGGKFFFDETQIGSPNKNPVFMPLQNVNYVTGNFNTNASFIYNMQNQKGRINSFTILDGNGTLYTFAHQEGTDIIDDDYANAKNIINAWHLTEILTNKGDKLEFVYQDREIEMPHSVFEKRYLYTSVGACVDCQPSLNLDRQYNATTIKEAVLKEIIINNGVYGRIKFIEQTQDRQDWNGLNNLGNSKPKALDRVEILDGANNVLKTMKFTYLDNNSRLTLDQVQEFGVNNAAIEPYKFDYFNTSGVPALPTTSNGVMFSEDHWGYYNAKLNTTLIPDFQEFTENVEGFINKQYFLTAANRSPDFYASLTGQLNKITYPTKGAVEFTYEANQYNGTDFSQFNPCSGDYQTIASIEVGDPQECQQTPNEDTLIIAGTEYQCVRLNWNMKASGQTPEKVGMGAYLNSIELPNYIENCAIRPEYKDFVYSIVASYFGKNISRITIANDGRLSVLGCEVTSGWEQGIYYINRKCDTYLGSAKDAYVIINNDTVFAKDYLDCSFVPTTSNEKFRVDFEVKRLTDTTVSGSKYVLLQPGAYVLGGYICADGQMQPTDASKVKISLEAIPLSINERSQNRIAGGVRIKEVKKIPSNNPQDYIIKTYSYMDEDSMSTGRLAGQAEYKTSVEVYKNVENSGTFSALLELYYAQKLTSGSLLPLANTQGNPLGYSKVTETEIYRHDNTTEDNGRIVHTYLSPKEQSDNVLSTQPFYVLNQDWRRGHIITNKVYDKQNRIVQQDSSSFSINSQVGHYYSKQLVLKAYTNKEGIPISNGLYKDRFIYKGFPITAGFMFADQNYTTSNYYYNNALTSVSDTSYSFYDNPSHLLLTRTQKKNSLGELIENKTYYPRDINVGDMQASKDILLGSHKITTPVMTQSYNDGELMSTTKYHFDSFNSKVDIAKIENFIGNNISIPSSTQEILNYDNYGNPTTFRTNNGAISYMVWAYNGQYPVANIENGTITDVNVLADVVDENVINAWVNNIRVTQPNAQVASYNHKQGIGVTSITDNVARKATFEYDDVHRLKATKDEEGNYLTALSYHYAQQLNNGIPTPSTTNSTQGTINWNTALNTCTRDGNDVVFNVFVAGIITGNVAEFSIDGGATWTTANISNAGLSVTVPYGTGGLQSFAARPLARQDLQITGSITKCQ